MQSMILWLKKLVKHLAVHAISGLVTAIGAAIVLFPFLYLLKWMFGPIPRVPEGSVPSLIDGWYLWLLVIVWLVLFWKYDSRVHQWFLRRFGLGRRAGLKYGGDK